MNRNQELQNAFDAFTCLLNLDWEGKVLNMNRNLKNCLNGDELPNSIFELCSGQFNSDYYQRIFDHVLKGFPWRDEIRFESSSGKNFWLDCQILASTDKSEIFIVGIEISGRKKNEELIQEQRKQIFIQSQFSALGEMASGIAHEINNPLSIISASAYYLKDLAESDNLDKEEVLDIFTDVEKTVTRISNIIRGLRNIARNPTVDDFDYLPLSEVFDDVFPLFMEKLKSKGIDLIKEIDPEIASIRTGLQKVQISQILINLLNNAFDEILEKNYESPWIKVSLTLKESKFVIEVRDCGAGIDPAVQEKIFNPFFTQKDIGKGTGLGLSLSLSMAQRHGGLLWVDQECPNTSFKLSIPLSTKGKLADEGSSL